MVDKRLVRSVFRPQHLRDLEVFPFCYSGINGELALGGHLDISLSVIGDGIIGGVGKLNIDISTCLCD